jgi:hypothetical protein
VGVKVQGIIDIEEMFLVVDTTTRRRVVKSLFKAGQQIQTIAKAMAPLDEGNLEAAIKMHPQSGDFRERDEETGRFTKTIVEVYIDMDMEVPQRPGKTVGDYAFEIHEHLTPMGELNLGPKSIEKQLNQPNVEVGGGFMTRAGDKVEEGLGKVLVEAINSVI